MTITYPIIIGNWKMNGLQQDGIALVHALTEHIKQTPVPNSIVVCPPATLLVSLAAELKKSPIRLGGQDCHEEQHGAYTGNISAESLKDAGCEYVIVGHSERRTYHKETDAIIAAKAKTALTAGLTPIICIGEVLEEREKGLEKQIIERQLKGSLPATATPENTLIAYEPVWAIGTGKTATIEQIAEMHETIKNISKSLLKGFAKPFRVVYGGSVNAQNAESILHTSNVDGVLVGGASLKADDFWAIIQAASHATASAA